jgi:CelD/BcsL family acetyltransferase involved in cellulose biosynthesis
MVLGNSLLLTKPDTVLGGPAAESQKIPSRSVTARVEVGGPELVRRVADRWERLCEETGSLPFYRPEWIAAYLKAFETGSQVVLMTASEGDRLVAVLPLIRKRAWFAGVPIWKLAGAANIHCSQFDILQSSCEAGEASIRAFWNLLKGMPSWNVLELPLLPGNGAGMKLIRHAGKDGHLTMSVRFNEGPILRLEKDGNGRLTWLNGTSRHFRHELRRYAKILAREAGQEPILVRRTDPDPKVLEQFYKLEASGWKGQEGSAIQCTPQTRTFYDQVARTAAEGGYFCLHSLETKHRMLAAAFSLETADGLYPLKIAYDESLYRGAPGQVMFHRILEECAGRGITQLFFGGGNDPYKMKWTSEILPSFTGYIFRGDFRSRLAFRLRTLHPGIGRPKKRALGPVTAR